MRLGLDCFSTGAAVVAAQKRRDIAKDKSIAAYRSTDSRANAAAGNAMRYAALWLLPAAIAYAPINRRGPSRIIPRVLASQDTDSTAQSNAPKKLKSRRAPRNQKKPIISAW